MANSSSLLRRASGALAARIGRPASPAAALREGWERDGYVVLPGFYDDSDLDPVDAALRDAWTHGAERVVVDDLVTNTRSRLVDVGSVERAEHRFKVNDLYLESEPVRRLALNARLTPILNDLLGHTPALCNSLSFEQGSAQADHVDAIYMTPRTEHHLIAIWVALEDCHLDAGPLRYYPGSHVIPQYRFSNGGTHAMPEEMDAWTAYMNDQVQARGLEPRVFPARRGDVFIWSAYLFHGGSPIIDPLRTRKSIVFHYFSSEDAEALGLTLVPFAGGAWIHRAHQPVPGRARADVPPLPTA